MPIALSLSIVLALVLLNGFFAMAEMAIVASSENRLEEKARDGKAGAAVALRLSRDPGRFLSSVQTGITLVGVIASAFSGATIAARFGSDLNAIGWIAPHGESVALVIVVAGITFASVVLGELVPKRIALANPEGIAAKVARPLAVLSTLLRPAVAVLNGASEAILRLLGIRQQAGDRATEQDLRHLLAEATRTMSIDPAEEAMVKRVIRLADRSVQTIMTPRIHVAWVDLDAPAEEAERRIMASDFSRLIAARGGVDHAEGAIRVRDFTRAKAEGDPVDLKDLVRPVAILPDTASIVAAIDAFRKTPAHVALVIDEHGGLQGIVTPTDILESITGYLAEDAEPAEALIRPHADGYLVDGRTPVDELRTRLDIPLEVSEDIQSAGGLVMDGLGHVPKEGEAVALSGWRFEVLDMDGRRIDKLFLRPPEAEEAETE